MKEDEKKILEILAAWDHPSTDAIKDLHATQVPVEETPSSVEQTLANVRSIFDSFFAAEDTQRTPQRVEEDLELYEMGLVTEHEIAAAISHLIETDPQRWERIRKPSEGVSSESITQRTGRIKLKGLFERLTGPGTGTMKPAIAHFGAPATTDLYDEFPMPEALREHFVGPMKVRIKTFSNRQVAQVRLPRTSNAKETRFNILVERTLPDGTPLGTVRVAQAAPRVWTDVPLDKWNADERWRLELEGDD
jgi:hypothetical protein